MLSHALESQGNGQKVKEKSRNLKSRFGQSRKWLKKSRKCQGMLRNVKESQGNGQKVKEKSRNVKSRSGKSRKWSKSQGKPTKTHCSA